MSCWQSQIELNTSPTASGVVVCWRISRKLAWSSAGTGSSSQNSRYGSSALPSRAASIGVSRWWTSCSRCRSEPVASRARSSNSLGDGGAGSGAVDHTSSRGSSPLGRLVEHVAAAHAVGRGQPRDAALRADRLVAELDVARRPRRARRRRVVAVGVAVDHHPVAARAAEQLVDRQAGRLALDVPQRGVDGGDRGHRHRPAPPVGAVVEVLPGVLDARRRRGRSAAGTRGRSR